MFPAIDPNPDQLLKKLSILGIKGTKSKAEFKDKKQLMRHRQIF